MFVALDLSLTCIGWARTVSLSGSGREVGTIKPKGTGVWRLQDALTRVLNVVRGSQLVLLEGYAYGREQKAHQLGELGGVVRLGLHQSGIEWIEVPPSCVKKLATGNGNAKKNLVLVEAVRRLGYEGSSHDEADALWLLEGALHYYDSPAAVKLPQSHLGFQNKAQWPDLDLAAA